MRNDEKLLTLLLNLSPQTFCTKILKSVPFAFKKIHNIYETYTKSSGASTFSCTDDLWMSEIAGNVLKSVYRVTAIPV